MFQKVHIDIQHLYIQNYIQNKLYQKK